MPTQQKGSKKAVGSFGTRRNVDVLGHKPHKVWLWLAVERACWFILAWVLRDSQHGHRLAVSQALSYRYWRYLWYFTDLSLAYAKVLPRWRHHLGLKGKGQTSIVKAVNTVLRQRCGVLEHKLGTFSKNRTMHKT
ncbi:hypothetical protein MON38_20940 [Hymenobacter sp. DH14]|uniref:Uncharacterized protein n=1 Tax=Hymenobacter cyanobacteriorum TaxID=2926463 RepID=A0A9X1VJE3_9BACT|nr:hypothetical protein [Hymenobacter cyanobacteriorum]MCI1189897.1 hypothetical protein [Hymenobacter cyanobacteriorum]